MLASILDCFDKKVANIDEMFDKSELEKKKLKAATRNK